VLRVAAGRQAALLRAFTAAARGAGLAALEEIGLQIGVKAPLLLAELEALRAAHRPALVAGDGLGGEAAEALLELLATLGRPDRLLVLRRVGNALGRLRMGLHPATLPGGLRADVEADVQKVRLVWGGEVAGPGPTPATVREELRSGAVGAVLLVSTDPCGLPLGPEDVAASVFCVSLELGPSALGARADVVLPAAALAESAGSVLADDGRVLRTEAARPPAGGRSLFEVLAGLGSAVGQPGGPARASAVWSELARMRDGLGGLAEAAGSPGARFWA
jgi:predicted molibdopterin-dependent oxidoreductase YjgC